MHSPHQHLHFWRVNPSWIPDKSRRHSPLTSVGRPQVSGDREKEGDLAKSFKAEVCHPDHLSLSLDSLPIFDTALYISLCDSLRSSLLLLKDYKVLEGKDHILFTSVSSGPGPGWGTYRCLINVC